MKALASMAAACALGLLTLAGSASATGLTDGSGETLLTGTAITAESEGETVLHPPIGSIECSESHVSGKTTNVGGEGVSVKGSIEALSWSECNATVDVLAKGTLSITWTSGSNGTLSGSGQEVTVEYSGFHCVFSTSNTKLGTITGSANTKGNPTLDIEATISRTGGTSGIFCGSTAQWTGSYKFTTPSALNIDDNPPIVSTTLTDGSGGKLSTGSTITARPETTLEMHMPVGTLECSGSHVGGRTTNEGGGGANVNANVESLSWSSCNATMTVLKKGTLSFVATGGNKATVRSSGMELTRVFAGFHCIFSTNSTQLGTLTGGTPATLHVEATIPRTGGSSGPFCGTTNQWTGSYEFTTPSTLNID